MAKDDSGAAGEVITLLFLSSAAVGVISKAKLARERDAKAGQVGRVGFLVCMHDAVM